MKGEVLPGAVMTNKFKLEFIGAFAVPLLYIISTGEMVTEVIMAEMSDRTKRSTGETKPFSFDIEVPLHDPGQLALHTWLLACKAALPGYVQGGLMTFMSAAGLPARVVSLIGCICEKETLPAMNKAEDGKQGNAKYTISVDSAEIQL